MKKKIISIVSIVLISILLLVLLFFHFNKKKKEEKKVPSSDITIELDIDNSDEKIDWSKYKSTDISLKESLTIKEEGTYNLSGTLEDGSITVDVNGNVRLILDNVTIKNSKGPAIYVKEADDIVIVTSKESKNYLEDGSSYSGYDEEVIGTIYSHDDITFDGEGTLTIKSNKEDAIVGKDDLKIINGTYEIESMDDGIRGKDSVYIKNGNFTIQASGDGIKSTNNKESNKGFVLIENGSFSISSELDGIQAETTLLIKNGNFDITTGGGSDNSSTKDTWGKWGKSNETSDSAKSLKSGNNLVIENGNFLINSSDDSIHSNNSIKIVDGNYEISSGDDGIHADKELIIEDGTIDIKKSYEGLEAAKITINNGNIKVVAEDDGINVAGGRDSSAMNRPGANRYDSNTENILTIENGIIYVNANGDGLDANGSIYMNGGFVQVDGPSDSGNGALDYDREFVVKGGTLLAGGASGMAQGVSSSSIYNVSIYFNTNYGKDDKVSIVDSSGKEIISYQSSKNYSSLIVASPNLKKGDYKILINGTEYESFTISNINTTIGDGGNKQGGFGGKPGMNDRPGGNKGERPNRRPM